MLAQIDLFYPAYALAAIGLLVCVIAPQLPENFARGLRLDVIRMRRSKRRQAISDEQRRRRAPEGQGRPT